MAAITSRPPAEAPPTQATCLIADDHPVIVEALYLVLNGFGVELTGHARQGFEALAKIEAERPALAILDLHMPGLSGIEVARRAAGSAPETAVILYTAETQIALVREALAAGVRGYVLKGAPLPDITRAIEMVAEGDVYIDPALVAGLHRAEEETGPKLTAREHEILVLLADGLSYDEMSRRLAISPETARTHVRKAVEKLGARTRPHALAIALRQSLID